MAEKLWAKSETIGSAEKRPLGMLEQWNHGMMFKATN
jgi:hypothetical protein